MHDCADADADADVNGYTFPFFDNQCRVSRVER